jgi:hypothetical protein
LQQALEEKAVTEGVFPRFREFTAPGADRFSILGSILEKAALPHRAAALGKSRHFFIRPETGRPETDPARRGEYPGGGNRIPGTVLVAHYDRAGGSPGANDNSAAVFIMIEAAKKLVQEGEKNWLLIFTDHEEVPAGGSLEDQGSFALARFLREKGFGEADFFIFDCCGTGDTLIISTTADHLLKEKEGQGAAKMRKALAHERERVLEAARNLFLDRTLLAPTPFSDDPGFLQAGLAAQTITCLPAAEAAALSRALRRRPELLDYLVHRKADKNADLSFFPPVWRRINSPKDSEQYLTPEYFNQAIRLACCLCRDE